MLHAEIPLVDIGVFSIEGENGINGIQWEWAVLIESDRERIPSHVRPRIIEGRTVHNDTCSFGRCVPLPAILVHMREIEKDPIGRPNDGEAIASRIPGNAQSRRDPFPTVGLPCVRIWKSAFALKINSGRSFGVDSADNAMIESCFVEESAFTGTIIRRSVGLPSHTAVQREM